MSAAQKRQRDARKAKQAEDTLHDLTCHPNPKIAAWAIENPDKARKAVEEGKLDELY